MRLLADMGVSPLIVQWLRQNGEDAVHLRDEDLQKLPDSTIFEKAYSEGRVVLTFDLDFGEIAAFSHGRIVSVILFRLHNTRTPLVIQRLTSALEFRHEQEKAPSFSLRKSALEFVVARSASRIIHKSH